MYLIVILVIAIFASVFFASSETIFSTVNKIKVRLWAKTGKRSALLIQKTLKNPDDFLIPTLIGNNIANIVYSSTITYILIHYKFEGVISFYEVIIYQTIFLVFFAEVIPKVIAKNSSEKLIFFIIYPFYFFTLILKPINYIIEYFSFIFMKLIGIETSSNGHMISITKSDIGIIIDEAVKKEEVDKVSANMINKILDMKYAKVKEIMTHRSLIIGLDINESDVSDFRKIIKSTSFSKIIAYDDNLDSIKGVVYTNDLIEKETNLKDVIKDIYFVPDNSTVYSLFKILKKSKLSISVVIDEYGGCVGIVTMQDIIEKIVGKIDDYHSKYSSTSGIVYRANGKTLFVNGEVELEHLNEKIKLLTDDELNYENYLIKEDKYETVNGFIVNFLQKIPSKDEEFTFNDNNLKFKIFSAKKNRVDKVIIKLNN